MSRKKQVSQLLDPHDVKLCVVCKRPFTNRKKWSSRDTWNEVKYCSEKCRREARRTRRAAEN